MLLPFRKARANKRAMLRLVQRDDPMRGFKVGHGALQRHSQTGLGRTPARRKTVQRERRQRADIVDAALDRQRPRLRLPTDAACRRLVVEKFLRETAAVIIAGAEKKDGLIHRAANSSV